ncbi:MAG TPA: thioredoxin domain-containing protein [Solirubrobacteraceae bacterium]|nr:thioredoxin domain-containing protein [Solirubrobacteraceae bacterium]
MTDLRSAPVPDLRPGEHLRGPEEAPVVIVYADFTCPRCALAQARLSAAPLRVAFRHFALSARHPRGLAVALAAEAAGQQGAFWAMHDSLFADPARLEDPHLWARARTLGLDLERFEADRRAPEPAIPAARVARDLRDGLRAGVAVTPTLFVDGRALPGPPSEALLADLARPRGPGELDPPRPG